MEKLIRPYLFDILQAIAGIEAGLKDKTFEEYVGDWVLRRGSERGIEIISEAARRIPPAQRETQPQIPWNRILGIGNVLRHDYRHVVDRAIFETIQTDLPALKAAITAIDADLNEPDE